MSSPGPLLACRNVSKYFGALAAVHDLSFELAPGEVLGIEGLIDEEESLAEFRTLTGSLLYRIDKEQVRNCLAQRGEVQTALTKLQRFRRQNRESLLMQKPPVVKKGGFLSWLHK